VPVAPEQVADTLLRMARQAAVARRPEPTAGERTPDPEALSRLASILARLPAGQATALALAYGEGLSDAEVAIAIGLDESQVRELLRVLPAW
jgi:DNA-directed RNA polymerase specialized sigma24 family protein